MRVLSHSFQKRQHRIAIVKYVLTVTSGILLAVTLIWPHVVQQKDFVNKMLSEAKRNVPDKATINMQQVFFKSEDAKHQPFTISAENVIETDVENNIITLAKPTSTMKLNSGLLLSAQSPSALLWQAEKVLRMNDPITITSDNGHTATVSELTIDEKARSASSPKPITVTGPQLALSADSFALQDNGDNVFLYGKVNVRFRDAKRKKTLTLKAQKDVHMNKPTNTITATEKAQLYDGTNTLTADRLVMHTTQTGQHKYEMKDLEAYGHVVIKTPTDTIYGDEAFYSQDTAVVKGNARIERKEGRLTGSKISVDMKTGISKIISDSKQRVKGTLTPSLLKGK